MPRPRLPEPATVIRTAISLRPGEDDDLLALFAQIPPRKYASFIKAAMRQGAVGIQIDGLPDDEHLAESLDNFLL